MRSSEISIRNWIGDEDVVHVYNRILPPLERKEKLRNLHENEWNRKILYWVREARPTKTNTICLFSCVDASFEFLDLCVWVRVWVCKGQEVRKEQMYSQRACPLGYPSSPWPRSPSLYLSSQPPSLLPESIPLFSRCYLKQQLCCLLITQHPPQHLVYPVVILVTLFGMKHYLAFLNL